MASLRGWAAVLWLLAVLALEQGLSSGAADPGLTPSTTVQTGLFKRLFNAAKGLVWSDSAVVSATASTPTLADPAISSTQAHVQFMKAAHLGDVARINFSLRVLNEDLHVPIEPVTYMEGSPIYLEARVHASPGLFPKIFIDECYGTTTKHLGRSKRVYIITDNHGCLYAQESEMKASWFRKEDSAIVVTLPAFLLTGELEEEEIYIHCLLTAWSRQIPTSPGKKACYFDGIASRWKNMDEPSRASVCHCCDGYCHSTLPPSGSAIAFANEGGLHREVAGPLVVRKEDVPWFEGRCHTMKKLLLVSVAFVGSCLLAALLVGSLLALAIALFRYSRTSKGHRLLKDRKEQPFHTELRTVVGALAAAEADEEEKDSSLDYCKLKADTPDQAETNP